MHNKNTAADHAKALAGVLGCLLFSYLLYHSLAGGTLLDASVYDSYSLQAENWLAGRCYIQNGEQYTWLELAIYGGRYYQSFPPVPAVLMLPLVAWYGTATAVPSNLVAVLLCLGICAGVYACFWRQGASPLTAAFFALFCTMGSGTYWLGCDGGVWFMAQLLGLLCAVWGLFCALTPGTAALCLTSLLFGLAVGCRPFYAVLGLIWGLRIVQDVLQKRRPARLLFAAVLPAALVAAGMMAYNFARFGSVLEFGHNYLPEFMAADYGQFSPAYLLQNLPKLLRPVLLDSDLQLHFDIFNGFLFIEANPIFLLALLSGLTALRRRAAPGKVLPLPTHGGVLLALCLLLTVLTCMHRTLGGWQFGTRYLIDLLPYVVLYYLGRTPGWQPGTGALTLCWLGVLFNLYGAVFMLSA